MTEHLSRAVALVLVAAVGCSGRGVNSPQTAGLHVAPGSIRYRLRLRHNPVDPGAAYRCFGSCQELRSPKAYVECLTACPGFEKTPGMECAPSETPPEAACVTVRKVPKATEPDPGLVVLGVLGEMLLVVGASTVCRASASGCGAPYPPPF
jgi:hypothetical protein